MQDSSDNSLAGVPSLGMAPGRTRQRPEADTQGGARP